MASTAPLSTIWPDASRTPLVRVSARKGMNSTTWSARLRNPASSAAPAGAFSSARRLRASSTIERPSGVSSWIEVTRAAVTASCSETPGAAVIDAASRFP